MLVLSRKVGEVIVIPLDADRVIKITVVDRDRGQVRIGIEAPRDIAIYRKELLDVMQHGHKPDDATAIPGGAQ